MAKIKIPKLELSLVLLIVVILVSTFFRLYRIGGLHTFHNDEGRDVMIAAEMIASGRPTFLGPQTSVGNMYLGPLYYYLMVPALLLGGSDPVGPAIMVALGGILTTYLIYLIGKKWFGLGSALASSFIFAVSPLFVHYTTSSWNPNLVPLVSALVILAWQSSSYMLIGVLFGVLFQLHYVAMAFALVVFIWIMVESKKLSIVPKIIIGFVIATLPFWIFEARHDFLNVQSLLTYIEGSGIKNGNVAPYYQRLINNTESILSSVLLSRTLTKNTTPLIAILLSALTALLSLPYFMPKDSKIYSYKLWYILISTLAITSILKETLYPHYLGYIFPVISLLIGSTVMISHKYFKYIGVIYVIFWSIYSVPVTVAALGGEGSKQKLKASEVAGYIMRDAAGSAYNVVGSVGNSRETTYVYYLRNLSTPPSSNPEKLLYVICEDSPCSENDINNPLLFARGAAHPYLEKTLTHPYTPVFDQSATMISNTHIVYGVWVARVIVGDNK